MKMGGGELAGEKKGRCEELDPDDWSPFTDKGRKNIGNIERQKTKRRAGCRH